MEMKEHSISEVLELQIVINIFSENEMNINGLEIGPLCTQWTLYVMIFPSKL